MKVIVVPYSQDWPAQFNRESRLIQASLGEVALHIHHIGSTAVVNLAAKPVIDILLEVPSLQALDDVSDRFAALGYQAMGEFGIAGRRYFRKGAEQRTHQIHAFAVGDGNIARHIAFRDYLATFPAIRDAYAEIKTKLASACNDDIDFYCQGKDSFVKYHEAEALRWKAKRSQNAAATAIPNR